MSGVQDKRIEIVDELPLDKDDEQILEQFIVILKRQVNQLKANELFLQELNKRKMHLQQTQRKESDKLLELQRNISEVRVKNSQIRDEIMYLDQSISLKQKVMAEQDLELLQMTDRISVAFTNYLNSLNLKLKFKHKCVLNNKMINFDVIVNTTEVCLAYDLVSERYDLISLYPAHPNFDQIRTFLNQTADVSGLLASVNLWTSAKLKNH